MIKESELKITGKTLTERTMEVLHQFIDGKTTLPETAWDEIAATTKSIGKNSAGLMVCDIAEKITNLFFDHITDMTFTAAERDVLLYDIEIIVNESFNDETAAYYYIYVVSNHANPTVARYIGKEKTCKKEFATLKAAREYRDNSDNDYYDAIFKVKVNASGCLNWNFVISVEQLSITVEAIIRNLEDSIAEHNGYATDPDYDELEQHDARIAVETFQSILDFINRITNN